MKTTVNVIYLAFSFSLPFIRYSHHYLLDLLHASMGNGFKSISQRIPIQSDEPIAWGLSYYMHAYTLGGARRHLSL